MVKKILIIDDEESVTKLFTQFLEVKGFSVTVAVDGKEGLRSLERECPDLVITDIMMPEMDGLELIRAVRKLHPDLPVVAMSGGMKATPINFLPQAKLFGASRIIEKPMSLSELLDAVNDLLQEK